MSTAAEPNQYPVTPMLEMRGITKRFPGVVANDSVTFDVLAGEVHTLLGENGAGKSTLMKILYGLHQPDEGDIRLNGESVVLRSPADAIDRKIGMIHQHFMLVPSLTVVENVALGLRKQGNVKGSGSLKQVEARVRSLSEQYGLQVDPKAKVWQLAVGERQRVEIIKALFRDVELLVLDEPTAVLTPQEVDDFFVILRGMAADNRGLIFISHKLHEVMELSNRITVLRNGAVTGTTTPDQSSREQLAQMMVGRAVNLAPDRPHVEINQPVLSLNNINALSDRGVPALKNVSLEIRSGEILGLAGVSGNGQRELAEVINGLRKLTSGKISVDGTPIEGLKPKALRAHKVSFVPEERMRDGAVGEFSVTENLVLLNHSEPEFSRRGFLKFSEIENHSAKLIDEFKVKTPELDTPTRNLSGGNIQKLILARELSSRPRVLIAAQPTRGVDIGAAEYIHSRLLEQRAAGTATLVISEDLDEIFALSDRIAVICQGEIMGIVDATEATREQIGLLMAGVK